MFHREILVEFWKKRYDTGERTVSVGALPAKTGKESESRIGYFTGAFFGVQQEKIAVICARSPHLRRDGLGVWQRRNEDEELRKFVFICAAGLLAAGLAFGGCGKKEEETKEPTQGADKEPGEDKDPDGSEDGEKVEPALTDEAKKLKQFADLEEGDTYARINIKDYGTITVKFFQEEAPLAVENFITHAKDGYYDGVTFHRVIDDFMIQGGDPDGSGMGGESIWGEFFADEFDQELHPFRGALCMANIEKEDTNGSQFFIVQADGDTILQMETLLDAQYEGMTLKEYIKAGYDTELTDEQAARYEVYGGTPWLFSHHTVFGQILSGYDVLDAVAGVETDDNAKPLTPVVIESIEVLLYQTE